MEGAELILRGWETKTPEYEGHTSLKELTYFQAYYERVCRLRALALLGHYYSTSYWGSLPTPPRSRNYLVDLKIRKVFDSTGKVHRRKQCCSRISHNWCNRSGQSSTYCSCVFHFAGYNIIINGNKVNKSAWIVPGPHPVFQKWSWGFISGQGHPRSWGRIGQTANIGFEWCYSWFQACLSSRTWKVNLKHFRDVPKGIKTENQKHTEIPNNSLKGPCLPSK